MALLEVALLSGCLFVASVVIYTFSSMVLKRTENVELDDEVDLTKNDYKRYVYINFAAFLCLAALSVSAAWLIWKSMRRISDDIKFLASLRLFMEAAFNGAGWAFPIAFAATLTLLFLAGVLLAESSDRTQLAMDGSLKLTMFRKITPAGELDADAEDAEEVVIQTYAFNLLQNLNLMTLVLMTLLPLLTAWATTPQTQ
jgi:magnesium-transporting ATPase (P-type)